MFSLPRTQSLSLESLTTGQAPSLGIQVRSLTTSISEESLEFTAEQSQTTWRQIELGGEAKASPGPGKPGIWMQLPGELAAVINLSVTVMHTPWASHPLGF